MINIFLDTLIYNFTPFKSFFFLTNINNKSLVYNISVGLFIDLFIIHSPFLNTLFMIIFYLLHKYIMLMVFIYYIVFASVYNFRWIFLNIFVINSIFILISYIKNSKDIKLFR